MSLVPRALDRVARQLLTAANGSHTYVDLLDILETEKTFAEYAAHFEQIAERATEIHETGEEPESVTLDAPTPPVPIQVNRAPRRLPEPAPPPEVAENSPSKEAGKDATRRTIPGPEMVEIAAEFFREHPNATGMGAYRHIETLGRPALKASSWEGGANYARKARGLSQTKKPRFKHVEEDDVEKPSKNLYTPPEPAPENDSSDEEGSDPRTLAELAGTEADEVDEELSRPRKVPRADLAEIAAHPLRCAQCGTTVYLDREFRRERMEDGDGFCCPNGCLLTYHEDQEGQAEIRRVVPDIHATTPSVKTDAADPWWDEHLGELRLQYVEVLIARLGKVDSLSSSFVPLCNRIQALLWPVSP